MDDLHIQAPDGSVVQFPAGTSDDVIKTVMAKNYGAPRPAEEKRPAEKQMTVDGLGNPIAIDLDRPDAAPNLSAGEKTSRALGVVDNAVRAVGNGIPFMDRIAAAGGAATGLGGTFGDYSGNLERERARNKALEEAAPIANTAAHLVGGAMVPFGAVGAAATRTGLLAKSLMGAGTGAGIGAAQGLSDTQDLTNVPDAARNTGMGALIGGSIGGLIPPAGSLIGKGYNALADALMNPSGISRGASRHLVDALTADGVPAVQQRMGQLGPDAMLADGGFSLQGKATGAALNNDEARSTVFSALKSRDEGTNQRIMGDVNRALGPAEDPQTVTNAIRAQRSEVDNKAYPAALDNAPPVQIAHILSQIDAQIPRTVGMERKALENVRDMISTPAEKARTSIEGAPKPASAADSLAADVEAIRSKYGDAAAAAYQRQQTQSEPSLLEFLASKGGLGPDSELAAIGAHGHVVSVDGVGRRRLVKQGGLPLDYAREAAEEAGYLSGGHGATSTPRDFLDAIDAEIRGQKRYPSGYEGLETRREGAARSEREQYEYERHLDEMNADRAAAGHAPLPDENRAPTVVPRVPKDDASVLHKVKQELDNVIQYDAPGLGIPAGALTRQQGALKNLRGQLNDALETQVPGYREANRKSAALAKRGEAVEAGTQYLGSGKTTPSPDRFAAEFDPLSQGEKIAFAKGSRGNIERVLGTKANDLQALRGELQGEGGWNGAKIATVHGQEAADQLAGSVDRNLKFRDTHNKIVENAQTAQRTAAKEAMSPQPPGELPIINPNMSYGGAALSALKKYVAQPAYRALQSDPTRHYGEIANVLTAQDTQRDAHLAALIHALSKRGQNAQAAPAIGDRAALAAALLGNEYLHGRSGAR